MTEDARNERNRTMLQSANPAFRSALSRVLAHLQAQGIRPRIQQCWRSPAEQQEAVRTGHSKLRWSYHNATTSDGRPDALAADVLDDDAPLSPGIDYLLALTRAARAEGLNTGIDWGLPTPIRKALNAAIADGTPWTSAAGKPGPVGWDSCHVEWVGISVADARAGRRPESIAGPVNA